MKRLAAVEGRFYADTKESVFKLIHDTERSGKYVHLPQYKEKVTGAVLPHAGHIFSAYQTIPFFRYLIKNNIYPETFIILHPNHSSSGPEIALEENSVWVNSIGEIAIDMEFNELLPYSQDASAQIYEHSAEVIIPFIQYYFREKKISIVPICMNRITSETARQLAKDIQQAAAISGRDILIIASSDFSHFLSPEKGWEQDNLVLEKIEQRDIEGVEDVVLKNRISVCGYSPIMTLMAYTALLESDYETTILARGHSGEVVPSNDVVDYISIMFHSKS